MTDQFGTTTLSQTFTTACGVFAPGHLGALTRYLPFELVDDVLDQPGRRGRTRSIVYMRVFLDRVAAMSPRVPRGRSAADVVW